MFLRIALGNYSNNASVDQMDSIKIYLHDPEKFIFFTEQDSMPNSLKIDHTKLQLSIQPKFSITITLHDLISESIQVTHSY